MSSSPSEAPLSPSSRPVLAVVHAQQHGSGPTLRKCKVLDGSLLFSERVRAVRLRMGLSLEAAAEIWGYSKSTICNWEAGRSEPRWSEWEAIERSGDEAHRDVISRREEPRG